MYLEVGGCTMINFKRYRHRDGDDLIYDDIKYPHTAAPNREAFESWPPLTLTSSWPKLQ